MEHETSNFKSGRISVIIPAYNCESTIERAIQSVLQQSYRNFEILIVNDGSTDHTASIIEQYSSDSRINRIDQTNSGVSAARNKGIDNATGEYIIFLDSDDELCENALEHMLKVLKKYNADICSGNNSTYKDNICINESSPINDGVYQDTGMIELCLMDYLSVHHVWAALFSRKIIGSTRFIEQVCAHEDSYFMIELAAKKPIYTVTSQVVYRYYASVQSTSHNHQSGKVFDDILMLADKTDKMVMRDFPQFSKLSENNLVKAHMAVLKNCPGSPFEVNGIRFVRAHKDCFIPDSKMDQYLHFLICYRLYWIYKIAYKLKFG